VPLDCFDHERQMDQDDLQEFGHAHLSDKQEKTTQTVLEQAEVLSELWSVA
jgi:hypothetical protein